MHVREGVQPRSERPALPRRAARIRGGPSCDSKMKALLSKQYRTTRVDPLHSYLATNRILQLIFDITCIHEREGSVKLAARRGAKKIFRRQARAACFSNDWTDFWAARRNCRHALTPLLRLRYDEPTAIPSLPPGWETLSICLSVVTHTHPVHVMRVGGGVSRERPALPRRAARIRGGPSCDSSFEK